LLSQQGVPAGSVQGKRSDRAACAQRLRRTTLLRPMPCTAIVQVDEFKNDAAAIDAAAAVVAVVAVAADGTRGQHH